METLLKVLPPGRKDNMDILIKQASINNIDDIAKVEALCFPAAEAASKQSLESRLNTFPESFFIAVKNERVIGFINGCVTNDTVIKDELFHDAAFHDTNGDYQAIFGLDVIPEYRNNGFAALLMYTMIKAAKNAGRKGLILTCKDKLIHYYEKFGYINKGVSNSVHGGAVWYDMILEF